MRFSAVIVAGGSGRRAGGAKQWRSLAGKAVARWSVEACLWAGADDIILVIPAGDERLAEMALAGLSGWRAVAGGSERRDSVLQGLAALKCDPDAIVLIHDAARPLLSSRVISELLVASSEADGAVPALPIADTLKRIDSPGGDVATISRAGLWRAQTPQAFRRRVIEAAYAAWPADEVPTDEASVVERAGGHIVLTPGDPKLLKLTYPEDFEMVEALAGGARLTRTGLGFDAHRFGPGDGVWLCGLHIPHDQKLIGHSDADAGLHALTDAILGAIAEGDIGDHFPPSDPRWKGVDSAVFLKHAVQLVTSRGGRLLNVDLTLICEQPKIKPHREAMRERLAVLLGLPLGAVSVKATTTEAMGFTGRGEGLAAQAIVSVETPA